SAELKKIIEIERFASGNKIKVLGKGSSNGIDTTYFNPENYSEEFRREFKSSLGIPSTDINFIFIGRLVSEKGINELVAAFRMLQTTQKNITLLLVGPLEANLDPLNPETLLDIKNNPKIKTTGYQQDVRPYLAVADVLTFPSYREGFPNVVMQAGAMGIPAIVSDINGCNEIIENGQNGVIIPLKNEEALLKAMSDFLINPEMTYKLSSRAREIICSQYDRKEFWRILKQEYEMLEEDLKST